MMSVPLGPFLRPVVYNSVCLVLLESTKGKKQALPLYFSQCKLILIDRAVKHLWNIHFPGLFLPGMLS